jgi:predicted Fe-S protein YdhL (DUF1289 family)
MDSGLCRGCGRTLEEIARWNWMSEAERLSVMATLEERLILAGWRLGPVIRPGSRHNRQKGEIG